MKALAIDTSLTRITICAKNEDKVSYLVLDIGMKQSEKLLPSIEFVLSQVELKLEELDYTVLCKGPGSFTGLRLAFSCLKAIELSHNIPVYGVSTLEAYSFAYEDLLFPVICAIDAKKNKFYSRISIGKETIVEEGDFEVEELKEKILEIDSDVFFVCGSDAKLFISKIQSELKDKRFISLKGNPNETENLFTIAESMIEKKLPALQEFEGPVYIRASEAEENLQKTSN